MSAADPDLDRDVADAMGEAMVDLAARLTDRDPGEVRAQLDVSNARRLNARIRGRQRRRLERLTRR